MISSNSSQSDSNTPPGAATNAAETTSVNHALRTEIKRRKALIAHQRIIACSAEIESQTGIQPSSVYLIRQLREGEERHS